MSFFSERPNIGSSKPLLRKLALIEISSVDVPTMLLDEVFKSNVCCLPQRVFRLRSPPQSLLKLNERPMSGAKLYPAFLLSMIRSPVSWLLRKVVVRFDVYRCSSEMRSANPSRKEIFSRPSQRRLQFTRGKRSVSRCESHGNASNPSSKAWASFSASLRRSDASLRKV